MDKIKLAYKNILVTGGNGFLGQNLVTALNEYHTNVYILDTVKKNVNNEFICDINDINKIHNIIKEIHPDIIFHLAANLTRDRNFDNHDEIIKVNYSGTVNLLKALQNVDYENFIFTSSSEVYGLNKAPFKETMCPIPTSPYSMSKYFAEIAIRTFSNIYKKNYTILRLFNFYGYNMPDTFFISQLLNSLKNNSVFKMTAGKQKRDFVHIDDVINAMLIVASNTEISKNEIFNICTGKSITIKELALYCKSYLNSECRIEFGALKYRENEIWDMTGDNTKIINKLGFKIQHNLNNFLKSYNQ